MGKSGILYVVGTGPGSSDFMTLGAVRTLQKCPVIFYPDIIRFSLEFIPAF